MAHRSDGRGRGDEARRAARGRGAAATRGLGCLLLGLGLAVATGGAWADGEPSRSVAELWTYGAKQSRAVEIEPGIFAVNGTSNAYLISTVEGSVLVDTGGNNDAARFRDLLGAVQRGPLLYVILTHAHEDHVQGLPLWRDTGAKVVAHRRFREYNASFVALERFRYRRGRVLWSAIMPEDLPPDGDPLRYRAIEPDLVVDDRLVLNVDGMRIEVLSTPGGEGADSLSVWLPARRILFTADLVGPMPDFPNLSTIRGEQIRFAMPYVESLDRVLALEPEVLLPGHFEPMRGRERIQDELTRVRDAVRYVHDRTVAGMNQGRTLEDLMREITLPPELAMPERYGKVSWGVRAIWEGYSGWFHDRSPTELYPVRRESVDAEIAALAGGADPLALRARAHLDAGEPVEALHLVEVALAVDPKHEAALRAQLDALRALRERAVAAGGNFQELGWLAYRIRATEQVLGEAGSGAASGGAAAGDAR